MGFMADYEQGVMSESESLYSDVEALSVLTL